MRLIKPGEKTVEELFEAISEKSWRQDKKFHGEQAFNDLIDYLQENKDNIINESVNDIKMLEEMNGDLTELKDYKRWIKSRIIENITSSLRGK
jgi:hypothetical protein